MGNTQELQMFCTIGPLLIVTFALIKKPRGVEVSTWAIVSTISVLESFFCEDKLTLQGLWFPMSSHVAITAAPAVRFQGNFLGKLR